jgi:hypothetical protein
MRYTLSATLLQGEVQGKGELTTPDYAYTGSLRHGQPDGSGFLRYRWGAMYEGELAAGKAEGKGILVMKDRSEYSGEWKNGKADGDGEATFALGGSYRGQWRDGEFHGRGTIAYAGSGTRHEGQFEHGRIAGSPAPIVERGEFALFDTVSSLRKPASIVMLPPDASWDMLTEAQKNMVRSSYPALAPGDDPPYPSKGTREATMAVIKINRTMGAAEGSLLIHVLVGTDGKAKSVTVLQKPTLGADAPSVDTMVKYVASVAMLDTYKPAMCKGQPCEMVYPLEFNFEIATERDFPPGFR